jgi:uncharacterized FAD-dependent dehydrogenase
VVVVGSGPAGFFGALTLLKSGLDVTIIEQGPEVYDRTRHVRDFEKSGVLNDRSNYAFGEGGAGTFSDGKLTSRTKSIYRERHFIFQNYVRAGGPEEILYLSKPHLGSNVLTKIVKNLRQEFLSLGGKMVFNNKMIDFYRSNGKVDSIETEQGKIEADYFIFAIGHSSYDTYRLLMRNGVQFGIKNFAVGSRVEHNQEMINIAKWKRPELPGVKAADYSLTYTTRNQVPVYSFCMCPGGMVVPAAPSEGLNIVNGMSNYKRNYPFANSAIVAGMNLPEFLSKEVSPEEALEWVVRLERKFFNVNNSYDAPAVRIGDFLEKKTTMEFSESSYPFKLIEADFRELFPKRVCNYLMAALRNFSRKIHGFEDGVMMGLESRTSSPIQVERDGMKCAGFDNLYIGGEGSGLSGGIVSSGADGIKCAIDIIEEINKN